MTFEEFLKIAGEKPGTVAAAYYGRAWGAATAAERERCADIAERGDDGDWSKSTGDFDAQRGKDIARVIRLGSGKHESRQN